MGEAKDAVAMGGPARLTFDQCRDLLEGFLGRLQALTTGDVLAAALFGSVARSHGGPTSDLDLLIVHRGPWEAMLDHFVQSLQDLRRSPEYQQLCDRGFLPDPYPVFLTPEQLARHPWILLDVLDHGVILLDQDHVLRRELGRLKERLETLGARKITLPDGTWYWDLKPDWKPGEIIEL